MPAMGDDDPVERSLELGARPISSSKTSQINDVTIHWSDAHRLDIHDGEPVLLFKSLQSSSPEESRAARAAACSVRISPSKARDAGTRRTQTPRSKPDEDSATVGTVLIPMKIYEYVAGVVSSSGIEPVGSTTSQASPSVSVISNASDAVTPAKTKFSFKKGGGGDALISPPKYSSPSGSSFSFARGGGGESYVSSKKSNVTSPKKNMTKATILPLANLPVSSARNLCPEAKDVILCPVETEDQGIPTDAALKRILQTLIISKYEGHYIQHRPSTSDEVLRVTLRGKAIQLKVVSVKSSVRDEDADDEKLSSALVSCLDISNEQDVGAKESVSHFGPMPIAYRITSKTNIGFSSKEGLRGDIFSSQEKNPRSLLPVCAGLDETISRMKETLLPPLLHPEMFPEDGPLKPPKGCLVYGPHGVGKSLVATQFANEIKSLMGARSEVRMVQCADLLSETSIVGKGEKLLADLFTEVERKSGGLIVLDDIHLICPRRGSNGSVDQLAGTLLALLDGLGGLKGGVDGERSGRVVILAITTDPSLLDPALRRPGRLDVEIDVPVPHDDARAEILNFHLSQMDAQHFEKEQIAALARLAKGFTGADCKLAVKEAMRSALNRKPDEDTSLSLDDLEHAIRITKPSAIKSVAVEVPKVSWSAIGGMGSVKHLLRESIELPLTHPHLFEMMRVPPPRGILLYGPPGCSKTLMARAIATEGNMNFLAVKGPELLSKWLGESERTLSAMFRRARLAAPSCIFFDEIDAIASKRGEGGGGSGGDRLLSQLLTELDGVSSGGSSSSSAKVARVVVVGATNRPDVLDAALTRPGRMDRMIYVGLPDEEGRKDIFRIGLKDKDCHEGLSLDELASASKGYTGAEIVALCRDAALRAIGEMDEGDIDRPQVHMRHLLQSIADMKPRTTEKMLQFYDSFRV